jgi:2'-5' RNA ligase
VADQTGVMIALVPMEPEAKRLAVPEGLEAQDLHTTLGYFGDVTDLTGEDKSRIIEAARSLADNWAPFFADAFNVSMFNPNGEDPCIVLGMSGPQLPAMHEQMLVNTAGIRAQRSPYIPHITLRYTDDASMVAECVNRTGVVRYDRVRVGMGDTYTDFPLNPMGAVVSMTAAVNGKFWRSWPQAPRETKFSADAAIERLLAWSGGSAQKFNQAFLWRNPEGQPNNRESYRLPIADVINGKLTLIPRAVFSAAVILSGGHGGLEGVVGEDEREKLKAVLNQIYADLQEQYQDPRVRPPWLLGRTVEEREEDEEEMTASAFGDEEFGQMVWHVQGLVASVNSAGWSDMPIAATDRPWDGNAARGRLWDWAEGDFRRYRRGFLWWDAQKAEQKNSYKLPIADIEDGQLVIVPRAVNAVASVLGGGRGGVDIPSEDMDGVQRIVDRIQARFSDDSVEASAAPVFPHSSVFEARPVDGPTPVAVSADGQFRGHLWLWNKCHAGISDQCVVAPRSQTGYAYFHNGQVLTSDGKMVKVGKITMGTGHAAHGLRWIPAADHYDNTGTVAAIVHVTEDQYGGYAAGTVVSDLSEEQVQRLRMSPISGDWRRIGNNLELVAALAVNTPGFPIVASINGEVEAVLAAGILLADGSVHAELPEDATKPEKDLASMIDRLDEKVLAIKARDRGRTFDRLSASVKERGK